MISVKIFDRQSERSVEVGMIKFEGIKIWKRLGSSGFCTPKWRPKAATLFYRCNLNRLSVNEIEKFALRIEDLLSLDLVAGEIGDFTWQVVESIPTSFSEPASRPIAFRDVLIVQPHARTCADA